MSAPAGERRMVAVLFAEAEGLTAAAEHAGAEEGAALVDALFRRMRGAIEARGGTVDKFVGEGVMAVFGAPVAHGDDASRAALAAMGLRRDVEAFAKERGLDLAVRVGVNAGEVLWAGVAGERPTAMGDAVNVAQRLREEAVPGQILVSAAVESLARRRVGFAPAGSVKARGRVEPVNAFSATGERDPGTASFSAPESPMLGREAAFAQVRAALESGRGLFLRLEGDAGIGKTRFLLEVRDEAGRRGSTAWGRASDAAPIPLATLANALRGAARREGAPGLVPWLTAAFRGGGVETLDAENFAHLIALSIGDSVPEARVASLPPESRREEARFAWEQWLRLRCAGGPFALFLDDLHAPDGETVALLESFASRLASLPLAVIVASRPGGRALAGFRTESLEPLAPADASRVARDAFHGTPSPELVEFVVGRAAGNPYALLELSRHLQEERLAAGDPLRLVAPAEGIPRGLVALLQAHLDSLGPRVKELLKTASVIGRTFWAGPLARLAGTDPAEPLAEGERLGILLRHEDSTLPGEQEFSFRDALLRDAAYGLLPKRDRARLHAAAAAGFEARRPQGGRRAASLAAGQRLAAGENAVAAVLWLGAASEAMHVGQSEEALTYALEARRAEDSTVSKMAVARGLLWSSRFVEGADLANAITMDPAVPLAVVLDARLLHANALLSLGKSEQSLAEALSVLEAGPDPVLEGQAIHGAAFCLFCLGRLDEALQMLDRMEVPRLEAARDGSGTRLFRSDYRILKSQILMRTGDLAAAESNLRMLLEQHAARGLSGSTDIIRLNLGNLCFARGQVGTAEAEYLAVLESSRLQGDRGRVLAALQNLSNIRFARGDFRGALDADLEVVRRRREIGDRRMLGATLVNVGASHLVLGNAAAAAEAFAEALGNCRATGDAFNETLALNYLGETSWREGRIPEAMALLNEALSLAETRGFAPLVGPVLHFRGRAVMESSPGEALQDLDRSIELARIHRDPRQEAVACSAAALVRARDRGAAEVPGLLDRALSLAPLLTACSERLLVLEDAVRARSAIGDAKGAEAALGEGLQLARERGAAASERRFLALRVSR